MTNERFEQIEQIVEEIIDLFDRFDINRSEALGILKKVETKVLLEL